MKKNVFFVFLFLFLGIHMAFSASYQVQFTIKDDGDIYGGTVLNGFIEVFDCNTNSKAEYKARELLGFDTYGKRRVNGKSLRLIVEQTMDISELEDGIYADASSKITWICSYAVIDSDTYELLENDRQIQVDGAKTASQAFFKVKSKLNFNTQGKKRVSGRNLKIVPTLLKHY